MALYTTVARSEVTFVIKIT